MMFERGTGNGIVFAVWIVCSSTCNFIFSIDRIDKMIFENKKKR